MEGLSQPHANKLALCIFRELLIVVFPPIVSMHHSAFVNGDIMDVQCLGRADMTVISKSWKINFKKEAVVSL